jgi:hypothetical protein
MPCLKFFSLFRQYRYDALDYHSIGALVEGCGNAPSGKKTGRCADLSSLGGENASEYVSLEDLAPLAMEKIEALSIEGLRIQSGMSEEDAPSNISAKPIGEFSSLQGKCAENTWSLGLEGTAGLQLLDVKQSGEVDGLMGLSITLDEWMRLDSGVVDEEEQYSDRTSKYKIRSDMCRCSSERTPVATHGHTPSKRIKGGHTNKPTLSLTQTLIDSEALIA